MDLLMPIIGCALGIVFSIMSIKIVVDKGKQAVVGAATGAAKQALQSPAAQTAITAGTAVATGGASLGVSAATSGIRMASNAATASATASATANATASAAGKSKMGKLGKAGSLMRGGAEAVAGTAGMTVKIGQKIAKDFSNTKAGKMLGNGLKTAGRKITAPVKFVGKKTYTLAGKAKNAISNSKVGQGAKKAITGVKNAGSQVYTSGKNTFNKIKDLSETAALKAMIAKDSARDWVKDKAETAALYGLEAKSAIENSKLGQGAKKAIKGVKSAAETAALYGMELGDYAKETAEYAKGTRGNSLRRKGMERIRKALEAENPKTGKDHFLGRLFDKNGTMKNKENEIRGEIGQLDVADSKGSLKDRMLVRFHAAKGTAQQLADSAMTALNGMTSEAETAIAGIGTAAVVGVGAGNAGGVIMPTYGSDLNGNGVAAIPMYGYTPEMTEMGIPATGPQLNYFDFSTLQKSSYDRNGVLMGRQSISNPSETMSQYSTTNDYGYSVDNIGSTSGISQHYESAMKAMNEHFQERFGTAAFSQEEGRAKAQMLDRLQTQREITSSASIRSDVLAQQQPEQQKMDAMVAELSGNSAAAAARQNYIESHTETIVSQQVGGGTVSDEDMQRIREQAQRAVEENFENRIKNEKGFRDEIFGQESSTTLESRFSEIDEEIEKRVSDAIASNRESLNAAFASQHPDIAPGEIDSARIKEDMKKDLEQMVAAEVTTQSQTQQRKARVQDNPDVASGSGIKSSRGAVKQQPMEKIEKSNPQGEQTGQKFIGSKGRRLGNSAPQDRTEITGRLDAANARNHGVNP